LIVLAVLATLGISLPTNSWLNEYLAPLFTKVATEEHHFGTSEYLLMLVAVIGGLVGIGIAYAKYIKQNQVPDEDANWIYKSVYDKYYVDEIYDFYS
jgi:NADH-quinone oxidoreductase subunit L